MSEEITGSQHASATDQLSMGAEALEALGIYSQATAIDDAFARILVLGPAKSGKTTCIAKTAPKPLIINCDGGMATKGASNQGAEFLAIDASTRTSWRKAVATACKLAADGVIKTIMVDSLTLLSDNLLDEITLTLDGWDIWKELKSQLVGTSRGGGIKQLMTAEAHLFLIAHMTPDFEGSAGVLPSIGGAAKVAIPALVDDWIMLDVEVGRNPERQFLLGPQKNWTYSGRHVKRTCAVEADVGVLFAELGIKP